MVLPRMDSSHDILLRKDTGRRQCMFFNHDDDSIMVLFGNGIDIHV